MSSSKLKTINDDFVTKSINIFCFEQTLINEDALASARSEDDDEGPVSPDMNTSEMPARQSGLRMADHIRLLCERFFTVGKLVPNVGQSGSAEAALLVEVEAAIAGMAVGHSISREIEMRFHRETAGARRRLFTRVSILGMILYNSFLPIDALVVPDIIRMALVLHLCVVTPLAVLVIVAIGWFELSPDGPSILLIGMILLATLALFVTSTSPHVDLFACLFCLIVLAGNIGLGYSFKYAWIVTVIGNMIVDLAIAWHPMLDRSVFLIVIGINVSASFYSLIGNYRIEGGVRQAYLFALREALRAGQVASANVELRDLVETDGLTGVANRRHFDKLLAKLWQERADAKPVGLLMIDIDHFKSFNDRYGHQAGDECLRVVARALSDVARMESGTLARYGGEEFALLIEGAEIGDALRIGERLRLAVAALDVSVGHGLGHVGLTISIGCASLLPGHQASAFDLVATADSALYRAKLGGRNRTHAGMLEAA